MNPCKSRKVETFVIRCIHGHPTNLGAKAKPGRSLKRGRKKRRGESMKVGVKEEKHMKSLEGGRLMRSGVDRSGMIVKKGREMMRMITMIGVCSKNGKRTNNGGNSAG